MAFLFSDTQIVKESFLEDINNILNTGEVPNLFAPDEAEQIVGLTRPMAKAAGKETRDLIWQFFVAIVVVPSVAYQLMAGVIIIAVGMTPIGIWRLRRMDLVEKVKDLSQ